MVTIYVESNGIIIFEYYMKDIGKKKYYKDRKSKTVWTNTHWGFWIQILTSSIYSYQFYWQSISQPVEKLFLVCCVPPYEEKC